MLLEHVILSQAIHSSQPFTSAATWCLLLLMVEGDGSR